MRFVRAALILVFFCMLISSTEARAATPMERIQQGVSAFQEIIEKKNISSDEKRRLIRNTLEPWFDFEEMAKRSLGIHRQKITDAEFQEFTPLFIELVERAYLNKSFLEEAGGIQVKYVDQTIDQGYATVRTIIVTAKGIEHPMVYRMRISPGGSEWKVYDVIVAHVSMVKNFREQFNAVISKSSFQALLKRLRDKSLKQ